jgi:hypothetical protein
MIDFTNIRPHRGSQNLAFEELVVQLARRRPPTEAKQFRRIEGAGGDAGAEALWILHDGSEIGLQAKYFLRVRDIDWSQIDKSVKTTLAKRPNVRVYRIAFACDLTDKGGAKGQGKSGWTTWQAYEARWQAKAKALGRSINFEPITASNLIDWIAQPSAAGLARYWFGTDFLSLEWFAQQVHIASADLGERYTPKQHVRVTASLVFDGLARSPAVRARVHEALRAVRKHNIPARDATFSDAVQKASKTSADALTRVYSIEAELAADPSEPWELVQWLTDVTSAQEALGDLERRLHDEESARGSEEDKEKRKAHDDWRVFSYEVRGARHALRELQSVLQSPALQCDANRILLLTGKAGTGKSHLLAAEANRSLAEHRPALLLLGQQFVQGNPWDQCMQSLGIAAWPRDEFFGPLDAAGEAYGARTLILVDAVNEGAGANLWKHYLSGFIEPLAPYKHVAAAIACRTEYVPFTIPKPVLDAYPRVELYGFTTFESKKQLQFSIWTAEAS